ncbi:hypothetical protein BX666DRAFT_2159920 [Dichotomocladium elegans]|nr:hypothetical protein BX666DRAFT_2159920 [Dichotomocladium elegans]
MPSTFAPALAQFLIHPWSPVAVFIPALAGEALQHTRILQPMPTRRIALRLAALHLYWLAVAFNSNFMFAPILYYAVPGLEGPQKANIARYRFGGMNKVEMIASVISLDFFLTWRSRTDAGSGREQRALTAAVLIPPFVTAIQTIYFFPKATTIGGAKDMTNRKIQWIQYAYIGLEATKVLSLAVVVRSFFENMLAV